MNVMQPYRSEKINSVIDDLRVKLIDRTIPRGMTLSEKEIADQYGISRGSLRTALQFLEQEGLIKTLDNGRKLAEGLTARDVSDIWNLRAQLEYSAVKSIIQYRTADFSHIVQAISLINQYADNAEMHKPHQSVSVDMQLHRSIMYTCGNKPLIRTWDTFARVQTVLLQLNTSDWYEKEYITSFWERHNPLLVGIMQNDENILDVLIEHIERGRDICIDSIKRIEARTDGVNQKCRTK